MINSNTYVDQFGTETNHPIKPLCILANTSIFFMFSTYKIGQRKSNDFLGNKLRKGHTQYQGRGSLYAKIVCETNKS